MIDHIWTTYHNTPTTQRRNELVERYLYLAERTARLRARNLPRYEPADLLGAASLGLIRAIERFDPTRGVSFPTFAWYYMNGAITDQLRRDDRLPDSMRRRIKSGAIRDVLHFPLQPDLPDSRRRSSDDELEGLPPLATIVFYARYWLGHSFHDIARFLSVTEAKARDIHDHAITCLRQRSTTTC